MTRLLSCATFSSFVVGLLCAQADSGDVMRIGPGVTTPRLLHKVEPEYSSSARADHVQGTVVLQLVVDYKGRPIDITVLSPLGFGLDERAIAAVETWRFDPGKKNGKPVNILATVEVNFRFPNSGSMRRPNASELPLILPSGIWAEPRTLRRLLSIAR